MEGGPGISGSAMNNLNHDIQVPTSLSQKDEESCVSIFRSIMLSHNMLHGIGSAVAAEFALQLSELNVIDMLGRNGALTMGELSRVTFITPSSTTRTIKQLESYGLVERRRSSESERVVYVSLTRSGKNLFKKAYPQVLDSVQHRLVDSLNQSERLQLANLLRKLVP